MNNYGPFAASSIVHRMNKTMLIFYLFHQDINEVRHTVYIYSLILKVCAQKWIFYQLTR